MVVALLAISRPAVALPTNFQLETLLSGLDQPVYLAQLPDGRLLVGTKPGRIRIFDPTAINPVATTYLEITNIDSARERGLTSIAIDPAFATNGFIYVYYTHGSSRRNRISRFSHIDDHADPASETLIWQDNEEFRDCCHYGGGIGFGPDGMLYLATGEEFDGPQAQDLSRAGGKIIRINRDGSVPPDNPFIDGPGGNLDEIWAYGLRNPYRAHWDMVAGRLYIGEVGGNLEESSREDIHVGRAGANYGWPFCEGQCDDPAFDDPIYDYGHITPQGTGGAVTLGTVYRGAQYPASYQGALFFTDYVHGWIRYLTLALDGSVSAVNEFAASLGPIVHLMEGGDGALYLADISGSIKRISYSSGNQAPTITAISYPALPGPAPATVNLDVTASDPEGAALSYRWLLGDGSEKIGKSVSHQYIANGVYQVRVQVSDGSRVTLSAPVSIQVGNPPIVTISQPLDGALFRAGDTIQFAASATDPDEMLSDENYAWEIRFGHNTHTHPTLSDYRSASGTLEINTSGHDYHSNTRYEFEVTVTDSDGLSTTESVVIFPDKADLALSTEPAGLALFLDGLRVQTPLTYDTLIGFKHLVSAAGQQCLDGTQYQFESWSDGGVVNHEVTIPAEGMTLTAEFTAGGPCSEIITDGLVLHLEADNGVTVNGTTATAWFDLSGRGNDLTGFGNPQWLAAGPNGRPAVAFDGNGDKFERTAALNGLPVSNSDRTVIMVASYESVGYGGFVYGTASCGKAFGLGVRPKGQLMVESWCTNWAGSNAGTGAGWLVHGAILNHGQLTQYQDGTLIHSRQVTLDTTLTNMVLGANLDSGRFMAMKVAAVLVYDRALSAAEFSQVTSYLQQKYLSSGGQRPVAVNDTLVVPAQGAASVAVLANDHDPDGNLDPATVTVAQQPAAGTVTVDPQTGVITYSHTGASATADSFSYRVADDDGLQSNSATVSVTIVGSGNAPPQAGNDQASVTVGGTVFIDVLGNDVDPEGELDPSSVSIVTAPASGIATVNPQTGMVEYRHGGASVGSDSFEYTVADSSGLSSPVAVVSIDVQPSNATITLNSPTPGALVRGPAVPVTYSAGGTGYDHVHLQLDEQPHVSLSGASGTFTFNGVTPGEHTVTALLASASHQPLPGVPPVTVNFLVTDALGSPLAIDDSATVAQGESIVINVLANDADIDGSLDVASVTVTSAPSQGQANVDLQNGTIIYTHGGGSAPVDSFRYRVRDSSGLPSNEATVTVAAGGVVPSAGLVLHLEADRGVTTDSSANVLTWADQSGLANDLHAAGDPLLVPAALNGRPIIDFDGGGDKLQRTEGLLAFPQGNGDRTVILVAYFGSTGFGGFAFGNNRCNQTFGVGVDPTGMLAIQGWCNDYLSTVPGTGAGWLIQTATLESGQLSHFRNGDLIDMRSASFNTQLTRLVLGAEIDSKPYLTMQTAAVLVWNRALAPGERHAVESYLAAKYGLASGANQPPIALDDVASVAQGATVEIPVLDNDNDPDGVLDPSSVTVVQQPAHGTVAIDAAGALIYSHAGQGSADTIRYRVADSGGEWSNIATVTIDIEDPHDLPPTAQDDTATVAPGASVTIDLLANDADPEGMLDRTSVYVTAQPLQGVVTIDPVTGSVQYQHGGGSPQPDSFTYQVRDQGGQLSNVATVTISVVNPAAVPTAGLVLRLEAGSGVILGAGNEVAAWQDLSGRANDLSALNGPTLVNAALGGHPVLDFDGQEARMERIATLAGFPSGAGDRSVFMVVNYRGPGYGGFGFGTNRCNQMFGLGVDPSAQLMVQGWCDKTDFPSTVTADGWQLQAVVVAGGKLTHYQNGVVIDSRQNNFNTVLSRLILGAELDRNPHVDMQVAEILVYNRALDQTERAGVTSYLRSKYDLP